MPKVTKRVVDASSAKAKRYWFGTRELKGFGLLVLPTGVKSYVFQYRTPEGVKRRITIGQHGDWTPDKRGGRRRTIGKPFAMAAIRSAASRPSGSRPPWAIFSTLILPPRASRTRHPRRRRSIAGASSDTFARCLESATRIS